MNKPVKNVNAAAEENQKAVEKASDEAAERAKTPGRHALEFAYEVVSVVLTAVLIIMVLFTFGVRFVSVIGPSMEPTLHTSDWLILPQTGYKPAYGDVVVISQPNSYGENIVKRVIALEGQTIDINFATGQVYIDGNEIYEPYIANATINHYDVEFPVTVPEGHVFVMGDNRQGSIDSRSSSIGFIRTEYILGKAASAVTGSGYKKLGV